MNDGTVKENKQIEKLLTKYFERKYDLESTSFIFSHIRYKYKYFGTRRILDLNNGGKIKEIQEDIIEEETAHIPILVPNLEDWGYGQFMSLNSGMKLDDVIDLDSGNEETIKENFLNKIKQILPEGITIVTEEELDNALKDLGYTMYAFDFTSLGTLGDGRIVTEFCGTVGCDYKSFPKNVVSKEVADNLETLYSKNKLGVQLKRYGIGTKDKPIHTTDCFEEYTFEGKRYIRVSSTTSSELKLSNDEKIEDGKSYWIEIEESKTNDKLSSLHDISELQKIRQRR